MFDLVVIGAGPAGMMAAGTAAQKGAHVLLLEKMDRVGLKLGITGKGRCNLTNMKSWNEFQEHVHPNPRVFKPAFFHFTNEDTVRFFNELGLETVLEHGDRVFPASYKASDVVCTLRQWVEKQGVVLQQTAEVTDFVKEEGDAPIRSVSYLSSNGTTKTVDAAHFILATGGLSYPSTGCTGDGYTLAKQVGHTVTPCYPSLTALLPQDYDRRLEGISLKNVALTLYTEGVPRRTEEGEMAFTSLGIEGALGFRLSRQAVMALEKGQPTSVQLNVKPALTQAQLMRRWEKEAPDLRGFLPAALVEPFAEACKKQRRHPMELMQDWRFPIASYGGWARAVVTSGGIPMQEVHSKTLRSKCVDNLSFAGEILDLDGDTGGYNLQMAFSTGRLAADSLI